MKTSSSSRPASRRARIQAFWHGQLCDAVPTVTRGPSKVPRLVWHWLPTFPGVWRLGKEFRSGRSFREQCRQKSGNQRSVQRFRMQAQVLLARSFLLRVLFHPGFPTPARRGVAPRELEGSDIRVGDGQLFVRILRVEADQRLSQRLRRSPVEQVAFDLRPILARDRHVPAIVKRLFQRDPKLFFASQLRNPPLEPLVRRPRRNFQSVRIHRVGMRRRSIRRSVVDVPAFFPCHEYFCLGKIRSVILSEAKNPLPARTTSGFKRSFHISSDLFSLQGLKRIPMREFLAETQRWARSRQSAPADAPPPAAPPTDVAPHRRGTACTASPSP